MAYDQGYYEQPQRQYDGRAAQRPGPPQGHQQAPAQQYPQQYDDYYHDGYGYENYNDGYGQEYHNGYQGMNGGGGAGGNVKGNGYGNMNEGGRGGYASDMSGRGRGPPNMNGGGRGYPPSNQNNPPQQEYYGNDRGEMHPRGGGPVPNGRGGPMQRPPPDRGGPVPNGRGGPIQRPPDRGGPVPNGRGGPMQRPPPDRGGPVPNGRGGPMQRPPPDRVGPVPNGRGGPMQRPPPDRGGPQGQAYPPNGGPMNGNGRPMDDRIRQGQGQEERPRKPLVAPVKSPEGRLSFDNPFPTFPGTSKKTALSEEQDITRKMGAIDISSPTHSNRPGTAGSKGSLDSFGRRRGMSAGKHAQPSTDGQRSVPRGGYPPQAHPQEMPDQRRGPPQRGMPQGPPRQEFQEKRGPPPGQGYNGAPRQNGYGDHGYDQYRNPMSPMRDHDNFGPPQRSNTMPDNPEPMGTAVPHSSMDRPGMSASYNDPIGRVMPVRPATTTGSKPPPPPRIYPNQQSNRPPVPQPPYPLQNGYANDSYHADDSLGNFYDAYYEQPPPLAMPDFDAVPQRPLHRRGTSIEAHIQPGIGSGLGYDPMQASGPVERNGNLRQVKPVKSQPDFRAQAQAQTAIFEMAGDAPPIPYLPQQGYRDGWEQQGAPPIPHIPQQGYRDGWEQQGAPPIPHIPQQGYRDGWEQQDAQYNQYQGPPQDQGYDPYPGQAPNFQPPPRSMSAAPGAGRGFPNGSSSQNGGYPGPHNVGFQGARRNSLQNNGTPESGLPRHAPPVRAGLIPNSGAQQQQNAKPTPMRNYGGGNPLTQPNTPIQAFNSASPADPTSANASSAPPVTQEELDRLRLKHRNGNPNDNVTALLLAKKLAEASDVLVAPIADQRVRSKARERYIFEATKILKKLRDAQDPEAMFYFADCYGRGALGLEVNEKEAFTLYQSAAKLGHPQAAYRTAVCCELGEGGGGGTRKDPVKAIQWYKRAATLGDTAAMYKMGMIQLKGLLGQPSNAREAVVWLKRAAERADPDNPHALHELGLLYEAPQGQDTTLLRDEAYAFQLFHQAADLGYKFSQFRLGQAFEYGQFNCPIDARQSIAWYSKAAVQQEHQSELALSGWYLTGHENILQQSDTEAYLWARKAAMAKLAKAEYAMGYYCEEGIGTPKSLEDAKRWYWRAAAQNFPKAREKLEELKRNGGRQTNKARERISRSKGGNQRNNEECSVM
ncbi:hypothetical protein DSL72_006456 [Monilinia vaccinii-corymbosi]|uniref:Uncharacterized protein n=1 Tax=Monilinia vaccinii-corymbosi TaxID=61207 RepID=A0A8A3PP23_9HELO|nr:hypothetical protein DSL72_006456 [Monilinia vaccinii-corymbosi]